MYLKQSFRGKNNFSLYFLGTLAVLFTWQVLGFIPLGIAIFINQAIDPSITDISITHSFGLDQNLALALMILSFVIGFIGLYFVIKVLHKKKFSDLITARPKFDFKRAGISALLWTGIIIITTLPSILAADSTIEWNFQPIPFLILAVICLCLLPFQTSFEEVFFRGYIMQGLAVATKTRWFPLLVTSVMFGLMHSFNPEVKEFGFWMAMPSYVMMGLVMGILVVMDNGLELALGMHFANNAVGAMVLTSKASALQVPSLFIETEPSMKMTDNLIMALSSIAFLILCSYIFKWKDWGKIFRKIQIEQ
jgi:membrane protease YdiL (CAAX protease family)